MPAAQTASRNLVASFCPSQLETLANKVGGPHFRCKTCSLDELHPETALLRARTGGSRSLHPLVCSGPTRHQLSPWPLPAFLSTAAESPD